jgi:cytochrome b561
MAVEPQESWSRVQRTLHWTIAALVVLAAPMGVYMVMLPFRQLLLKFLLYQLHKTVGITVFLLALAQVTLHWRRGRPAWSPNLVEWQLRAAFVVHIGLFVLLIATPFLGYLTAATAPARIPTLFLGLIRIPHVVRPDAASFDVLRRIHLGFAMVLLVLALGHAAMALYHHWQGHETLVRMWRGAPARGKLSDRRPRRAA